MSTLAKYDFSVNVMISEVNLLCRFSPGVWKITGSCDIFQKVQLQRFEGNGISIFGIIVSLGGAYISGT